MIVVVVVIGSALLLGLIANRFVRPRVVADDEKGPTPSELISPIMTLTVLFLAFVLVQGANSHADARTALATEIGIVQQLYKAADFADEPQREQLQSSVVCYVRSVVHQEWPEMARDDSIRTPNVWVGAVQRTLVELAAADSPAFSPALSADRERAALRAERYSESNPTVPVAVYALVLTLLAVSLACLGFMLPRTQSAPQRVLYVVVAALLCLTVLVIRDLDLPFDGLTGLSPASVSALDAELTGFHSAEYGPDRLPCTRAGAERA